MIIYLSYYLNFLYKFKFSEDLPKRSTSYEKKVKFRNMQAHLRNSKSSLTNEKECHIIKNLYNNDSQCNNNDQNDEKSKFQFVEYSDSPIYSKPFKLDADIDYDSLKKNRENDDFCLLFRLREAYCVK